MIFVNHVLNGEACLEQCLESVRPYVRDMFVLIDDRTTDNTAKICEKMGAKYDYFRWIWNFGWAKNEALKGAVKHCGLKYGEVVMTFGCDWKLTSFDKDFFNDQNNLLGNIEVTESDCDIKNCNTVVYRFNPYCKWRYIVMEKIWPDYYTMAGVGTGRWGESEKREPKIVGTAIHYGHALKGKSFADAQDKYKVMALFNERLRAYGYDEDLDGQIKTMQKVLNNPSIKSFEDFDRCMNKLLERYKEGDVPQGLAFWKTQEETLTTLLNRILP